MSPSSTQPQPGSWLWRSLTSIRLTVFLLLILAALAVLGTVVPQDLPPGQYLHRYGEGLGNFLLRSGVARIYDSPWFLGPISLLALNILACLVHGLPQAIRRSLRTFTVDTALTLPERGTCRWSAGVDPRSLIMAVLRREMGRPRREILPDQEIYLWERGRFRPLGPYLVHLGLVLILAGGLIGKFWGIEGRLPLLTGEAAQTFRVEQATIPLPFQVRLDRFQVLFYEPGGSPKEFRSDLTFLQGGQEVGRAVCRVNEPVTFGGLTFYQASYGTEPEGPARLTVRHGGRSHTLEAPLRRPVDLPGGQGQIILVRVEGDLQGLGPAAQLAYRTGAGHPEVFWVFQHHPEMGDQPEGYRFTAASLPFTWYSVFQVKRDPGVWWVYAGFILFLPGFYLAFFRPRQRWAVILRQTPNGGWQARLLGASPRQPEEFADRYQRLMAGFKGGTPS